MAGRRFNFYGSSFFFYLLAIVVDFVAEDKGRPATNRPLMESVGAQMQARIPVADAGIRTELKVFFEPKNVLIILKRISKAAHLEDGTNPLRFDGERMSECLTDSTRGFNPRCRSQRGNPEGMKGLSLGF